MEQGRRVVLDAEPEVLGHKPKLDKVIFKIQADTAAEFQAFKTGEVAMIYPQPQLDVVDQIKAGLPDAEVVVHRRHRQRRGAVDQQRVGCRSTTSAVRQAIGYAIDRDAIVKQLFGDLGVDKPMQTLQPAGRSPSTRTPRRGPNYKLDLDKVDELMTGDGWAKGGDGIWAKDGKKPASFTIKTTAATSVVS